MPTMKPYPMKTVPIFKPRIWGGRKLEAAFAKDLPAGEKIGESWELADLPNGKSTIQNGPWAGEVLASAIERNAEGITGTRGFLRPFPLLVKLLDAQDVLSVQVHPDPETCQRMGRGEPKTECWFIIDAEPGAAIYKGLKDGVTKERFAQGIEAGTTAELLEKVPVHEGECHFLPAGTAHAIGAGLLIAEIQTPSDTTYRVFDWNRVDAAGQPRQLHIAEALESIRFEITSEDLPVTTVDRLVDCPYFKIDKRHRSCGTEALLGTGLMEVLLFISGGGTIGSAGANPVEFQAGDCVLIPAAFEGAAKFDRDTVYLATTL
jgi:mannose-6-phosphate isomerase